ncbi:glyoxalase [Gordoniibacillus kamchatkensis]|uniref:Glyoxalase n=1 Tax=Gordoniibacillus kamchatkensis TaxID=1590651 RepID=A0ABR5AGZ2_9BACL|nr:VOC family protein [Paenibacillus sp. VKM B-2647]KIL40008.1 glyoxalase [Paenibacillus sp. VKM B-2647]
MKHLLNWVEIPVSSLERAKAFYSAILDMPMEELEMGELRYAFFSVEDSHNNGALVQGPDYMPGHAGPVVYLNGGNDLNAVLGKVEGSGGSILMPKTFLSDMAGYVALFIDTEGNRIGIQSMA